MANTKVYQRSFSGGEMSPEMFGQIEDAKFRTGVALARNFVIKPTGPGENRAGLEFVCEVKDSTKKTRLIEFEYSSTQTMAIEMGEGYFRFHTAGATLMVGTCTAWATSTSYVVGDLVSESGTDYYCTEDHSSGVFATDLAAGKWYAEPATGEYEIPNPYGEDDLFYIVIDQSADVVTLTHTGYAPRELRRYGATNWVLAEVPFTAPIAAPTGVTATPSSVDATYSYSYVVTAMHADLVSESEASIAGTCTGNLYAAGFTITISWSAVTGAALYKVYKLAGGVYGYIGQTTGLSIVDDNIAADLSMTPPTYDAVFASAGDYPAAVSHFEQRRTFAGTINDPQKFWMTNSGTESTMAYSLPLRDSDRIAVRAAARQNNTIRHIVPLSQLMLLTSSAEWRVTSINTDAITPESISIRPQSYVGAGFAAPLIVNNNLLYPAARGGHVQECAYQWQANGFVTGDISLRAAHLFNSYEISDTAYSKAPYPIAWFVSTSGNLIGLTYIPEQQIGAWFWFDTANGRDTFESVISVAEDIEDYVYVIVKRYINGAYVRYIERKHSRAFTDREDAFFVDSGLTYDGRNTGSETMTLSGGTTWAAGETLTLTSSTTSFAYPATTDVGDAIVITDDDGVEYSFTIDATSSTSVATGRSDKDIPAALQGVATTSWSFARNTISGFDHLEGETLNILADGAVHPQKTVSSGAITLDNPASVVHGGLPIISDLQTLPAILQIDGAYGQGRMKNINQAWLRVYRSSGIWVGPDADTLVEDKPRTTEPYGSPPALKSEEVQLMLTPSWRDSGQVFIRQTDPLPLTIVALTLEVAIGG